MIFGQGLIWLKYHEGFLSFYRMPPSSKTLFVSISLMHVVISQNATLFLSSVSVSLRHLSFCGILSACLVDIP